MNKVKTNDVRNLAKNLGMDELSYKNISEREDQLLGLDRWPMFREIIALINEESSDEGKRRPDYLKITDIK